VSDAAEAIAFYESVFDAEQQSRFTDADGRIVHCELQVGHHIFAVTSASEYNRSPDELGGSPVILAVDTPEPDSVEAEAVARGAEVVFPVEDRNYGRREGRFEDPFGHLWIVGTAIEDLEDEEIRRRLDET
jgi:PhnB protein